MADIFNFRKLPAFSVTSNDSTVGVDNKYLLKNTHLGRINSNINEFNEFADFSRGAQVLAPFTNPDLSKGLSFTIAIGHLSTLKPGKPDGYSNSTSSKLKVNQKTVRITEQYYDDIEVDRIDMAVGEDFQAFLLEKMKDFLKIENQEIHAKVWAYLEAKATPLTLTSNLSTSSGKELGKELVALANEKLLEAKIPAFNT
jgi:hypothetical protein